MKPALGAWALAMVMVLPGAGRAAGTEHLTVWWEAGLYQAEDDALLSLIRRFEAAYPIKVDLSLHAAQQVIPRMTAALDAGKPPDVAFGNALDLQATAQWAYDDKLENISDLIEPIRNRFDPAALATTFLYDNTRQSRAFYAFPIRQQTLHVHYWNDMLASAGYTAGDIPTQWDAYWDFWCTRVQPAYRQNTGSRVHGVGLPMGVDSSESVYVFLAFMDAYNVKLVDDLGKLQVDDPSVRAGLIKALASYTALYAKGCTPPSSTGWQDPDNDVAFFNQTTILTPNTTLSIVAKYLDDSDNLALTAEQRSTARRNATGQIATSGFPNKPDGSRIFHRTSVKAGVVFRAAGNKSGARKFVRFLLEEANLTAYVEGSLGRWFPVTKTAQQRPFWKRDAARMASYRQFMNGAAPYAFATDHRMTVLNKENVWARAMHRVIDDKVGVEQAVDEMIARIRLVAGS